MTKRHTKYSKFDAVFEDFELILAQNINKFKRAKIIQLIKYLYIDCAFIFYCQYINQSP